MSKVMKRVTSRSVSLRVVRKKNDVDKLDRGPEDDLSLVREKSNRGEAHAAAEGGGEGGEGKKSSTTKRVRASSTNMFPNSRLSSPIVPGLSGLSSLNSNPPSPPSLGSSQSSRQARKSAEVKQGKTVPPKSARGDSRTSPRSDFRSAISPRNRNQVEMAPSSQGWVRKCHISPEDAKDHNTLMALMPASIRKNIPWTDLLSPDEWHIDDHKKAKQGDGNDSDDSGSSEPERASGAKSSSQAVKTKPHQEKEEKEEKEEEEEPHLEKKGKEKEKREKREKEPNKKDSSKAVKLKTDKKKTKMLKSNSSETVKTNRQDKPKAPTIVRCGTTLAGFASPRNWLSSSSKGELERKEGTGSHIAAEPGSRGIPLGEGKSSLVVTERPKYDNDPGKKEGQWRSRSVRRQKMNDEQKQEVVEAKKLKSSSDSGLGCKKAADEDDPPEEPSEGEDEEDIRGEDELLSAESGIRDIKKRQNKLDQNGDGKSRSTDQDSVPKSEAGETTECKTELPNRTRSKTVKMAMEEELLSRVKEKAPATCRISSDNISPVEEEEEELFFSESNEAVVIQLFQKAE